MTQFTGEDAYVLLVDRYTDVVAERAELQVERDHLQEMLDALEALEAEAEDDEDPEDYVAYKDFEDLSIRHEELKIAYDTQDKLYSVLRGKIVGYRDREATLVKDLGNFEGVKRALEEKNSNLTQLLNKANEDNAHLKSQLTEEEGRGDKLFAEKAELRRELSELRATMGSLRKGLYDNTRWDRGTSMPILPSQWGSVRPSF